MVVISGIANEQQCLSERDIELSVDDQLVTTTLYKPVNSSFTVRCRRCTGNRRPSWFNSNGTKISSSCGSGVPICTKNANESQVKDLMFSSFGESLKGMYRCTGNNEGATEIEVLG